MQWRFQGFHGNPFLKFIYSNRAVRSRLWRLMMTFFFFFWSSTQTELAFLSSWNWNPLSKILDPPLPCGFGLLVAMPVAGNPCFFTFISMIPVTKLTIANIFVIFMCCLLIYVQVLYFTQSVQWNHVITQYSIRHTPHLNIITMIAKLT